MPSQGATYFARPDQGSTARDPQMIFSHQMPGAQICALLQNAVTMKVNARRTADRIVVQVSITNDRARHDVPPTARCTT